MRILILIFLFISVSYGEIVINEFMYAPQNGEPEWIELFNNSLQSLKIESYKIGDSKSFVNIPDFEISPYSYLVLTKDPEFLIDKYNLPGESNIVSVNIPTLNNTFDEIRLLGANEDLIDSIYYDSDWGENGKSLERLDPSEFADSSNLGVSSSPFGGTPTQINTSRAVVNDISLEYIIKLDSTLVFKINNLGKNNASSYDLDFMVDINRDGFFTSMESIISEYRQNLEAKDSELLNFNLNNLFKDIDIFGSFSSIAYVTMTNDENHKNDTIHYELILPTKPNAVLINEIMFDTDDNCGEFIELYNNSNFILNLRSWEIFDKAMWDNQNGVSILEDQILMPRDYLLLTWDENLFKKFPGLEFDEDVLILTKNISLNKTNDLIVVRDAEGIIIDSLTYYEDWHSDVLLETKNISLEKIKNNLVSSNRSNWVSSTDELGSTPLQDNSFKNLLSDEFGIEAEPNPFFLSSTGQHDKGCIITYTLPYNSSVVNIFVYDQNGNKVGNIFNARNSSSSGAYSWKGSDKNGKNLQTGPYILFLEATDLDTGETYSDKVLVVIGN